MITWAFLVQNVVGSFIGAAVFSLFGWALAKWKLLPLWHRHKAAIMRLLYDEPALSDVLAEHGLKEISPDRSARIFHDIPHDEDS